MRLFSFNMKDRMIGAVPSIIVLVAILFVPPVLAQETISERYPAGSIDSAELAEQALVDVSKTRASIDDQYLQAQRDCYERFFVFSCLDAAKEHNRLALKQVRQVEVEANVVQRQAKVDERDRALAEQHIKDQEDVARRMQEQQEKAAAVAQAVADGNRKEQEAREKDALVEGQVDYRVKQHEAKIRKIEADEVAKAPERAARERAYQEKQKEAQAYKNMVEARKAERERERALKKQKKDADLVPVK